ncbi:hypothetical protein C8Q74DRAFT_1234061 [Fomes fomentarius]|nr:hypothetical protein C8Q74DRAFT_1234061 [Fomes fomentarius]
MLSPPVHSVVSMLCLSLLHLPCLLYTSAGIYIVQTRGTSTMGSTKVSLLDHKSVKGNSVTGQVNQQWTFIPFGNGTYAIQSMLPSRAGGPLYLSMSGKVVVMSSIPIGWNVDDEEGGLRIKWPKTDWTVDLNYGSSDPHTKIHLVNYKPPERAQMWSYARCSFDNIDIPSNAISQGVDELIPHAVIEKTGVLYLLQNWEKDAVLDVFSADNRSVKCWSCKHRERNQQVLESVLRLCCTTDHKPLCTNSLGLSGAAKDVLSAACGNSQVTVALSMSRSKDLSATEHQLWSHLTLLPGMSVQCSRIHRQYGTPFAQFQVFGVCRLAHPLASPGQIHS